MHHMVTTYRRGTMLPAYCTNSYKSANSFLSLVNSSHKNCSRWCSWSEMLMTGQRWSRNINCVKTIHTDMNQKEISPNTSQCKCKQGQVQQFLKFLYNGNETYRITKSNHFIARTVETTVLLGTPMSLQAQRKRHTATHILLCIQTVNNPGAIQPHAFHNQAIIL